MKNPLWLSLCFALSSAPTVAAAQAEDNQVQEDALLEIPHPRQGYYYSLGLHGSFSSAYEASNNLGNGPGWGFGLRLGQGVLRWMDLGLLISAGFSPGNNPGRNIAIIGLETSLYPMNSLGIRLAAGVGTHSSSFQDPDRDNERLFGVGTALTVGYSFYPYTRDGGSGGLALTPIAQLQAVQPGGGDAAYFGIVGLEITWWSGLPRNQLALELEEAFSQN